MSKEEKKTIYILLIIIIVFSGILVIRINIAPKYNQELYDEIYSEYDDILENTSNIEVNNFANYTYVRAGMYSSGTQYRVAGEIIIPKLRISYPVVNDTTDENLKIAPSKLCGPEMNEIGR